MKNTFFRLWEPGEQSPYISESEIVSSDSGTDVPGFDFTQEDILEIILVTLNKLLYFLNWCFNTSF